MDQWLHRSSCLIFDCLSPSAFPTGNAVHVLVLLTCYLIVPYSRPRGLRRREREFCQVPAGSSWLRFNRSSSIRSSRRLCLLKAARLPLDLFMAFINFLPSKQGRSQASARHPSLSIFCQLLSVNSRLAFFSALRGLCVKIFFAFPFLGNAVEKIV